MTDEGQILKAAAHVQEAIDALERVQDKDRYALDIENEMKIYEAREDLKKIRDQLVRDL